jgi:hypothetical protein
MKNVKIISTKRTVLRSMDTVTTVRAHVTGFSREAILNGPCGKFHKNHITFRFDNAPEDLNIEAMLLEQLDYWENLIALRAEVGEW